MSIDPGIKYCGWAVSETTPEDEPFGAKLINYGTIYGSGRGTEITVNIIGSIEEIMQSHGVTVLSCEDYTYIPNKHRGIFQVPALIGVIKYHWLLRTNTEVTIIHATKWKGYVCGSATAPKSDVRDALEHRLGEEFILDVQDKFTHAGGKGAEDCFDAIAQNLYMCHLVEENRSAQQTEVA